MESLLELCNYNVKSNQDKYLRNHLNFCHEVKLFNQTADGEFISLCNKLLNETATRRQGVYLLKVYLNQGNSQSIGTHLISWCHNVLKSSQSHFPVSFNVLGKLIELSIKFPDCRKHVDQVFVPQLVDSILALQKSSLLPSVLECLESCLQFYSRSCKNSAEKIETFLLSLTDCDKTIVLTAGRCFAKVQATRTIEYWHGRHISQIFTLNSLLDELFENVHEALTIKPTLPDTQKLKLPNIPTISQVPVIVYFQRLADRFCNVALFLEQTFLIGVGLNRRILVEAVLQIVSRVLSVTTSTLAARPSVESGALTAQIPSMHRAALSILNALILFGRSSLLPYSSLILKLIVQEFKSTEPKSNSQKPFEFIREKCFVCLKSWLRVSGSAPSLTSHTQELINSIFSDIKVTQHMVSLNISVKKNQKQRKGKKNVVGNDEIVVGETVSASSHLCLAALSCLELLLDSASCILTQNENRSVQETIVKLLLDQIRTTKSIAYPYSNPDCQAALFSCLAMLCLKPHPQFPPPLHFAQHIFNTGLTNSSPAVVEKCRSALTSIRHMLRPTCPSFNFPIDVSGITKQVDQENDSIEDEEVNCVATSDSPTKNTRESNEKPISSNSNATIHDDQSHRLQDTDICIQEDVILESSSTDSSKSANQSKRRHDQTKDQVVNKKMKCDSFEVVELSDDDQDSSDCEVIESYQVEEMCKAESDVEEINDTSIDFQEIFESPVLNSQMDEQLQVNEPDIVELPNSDVDESQERFESAIGTADNQNKVSSEVVADVTSKVQESTESQKQVLEPTSPQPVSDEDVDDMLCSFVDEVAQ